MPRLRIQERHPGRSVVGGRRETARKPLLGGRAQALRRKRSTRARLRDQAAGGRGAAGKPGDDAARRDPALPRTRPVAPRGRFRVHGWTPPLGVDGPRDGSPARKRRRNRRRVLRARYLSRALVLGGAGFIGAAACKELMRRGVETIAAGRKDRPYGTFTSYVAVDRFDEEQLKKTLDSVQPDVLLDLACFTPAEIEVAVRIFKGERYVFVSTGVYPHLNGRSAREEDFIPLEGDPPDTLDYFAGKRWCETILARSRDFPWTVIRPPAVFGPADHTLRIAAYIQRVEDGGPLLVPEESYERQAGLSWVKDIGYACALACDVRKDVLRKAYNAAFEGVSLRDLIEGIARAMGKPIRLHPMPFADLPDGASPYGPDPRRSAGYVLDRARQELGFEPSALEDALAETLAWYRVARPSHPGYVNRAKELALVS